MSVSRSNAGTTVLPGGSFAQLTFAFDSITNSVGVSPTDIINSTNLHFGGITIDGVAYPNFNLARFGLKITAGFQLDFGSGTSSLTFSHNAIQTSGNAFTFLGDYIFQNSLQFNTNLIDANGSQVLSIRQADVVDAAGGAIVDVQSRAQLNLLLAALRVHGLIGVLP